MKRPEFVCFCRNNHQVVYSMVMPANCPHCNAQIDLTRKPITKAEAERLAQELPPDPAPEQEGPVAAAPPAPATPVAAPVPAVLKPAAPAPATPAFAAAAPAFVPAAPPVRPAGFGNAPAPVPQTYRPAAPMTSLNTAAAPAHSGAALWRLSFFGERIPIPEEGGWIGRTGLGKEWFQGNLLVSRRHVQLQINKEGQIVLGPDNSLNGVSYDAGQGKRKLENGEKVILPAGATLWLYNIPLKLESDS